MDKISQKLKELGDQLSESFAREDRRQRIAVIILIVSMLLLLGGLVYVQHLY